MNTYQEMYKNICRICLSFIEDKKKVCLVDNNSEGGLSSYGKAVTAFANIVIHKENNLPYYMCVECLKLLKQAIMFKMKCENSDKQLLEWTQTFNSKGDSESKIDEVIVQNIMFTQYFPEEITFKRKVPDRDKPLAQNIRQCLSNGDENSSFNEDFNKEESSVKSPSVDMSDELLSIMEKSLTDLAEKYTVPIKPYKQQQWLARNRLIAKQRIERQIDTQKRTVRRSQATNVSSAQNSKEKFVCKICNKDLANQNTFRNHMQRHNGYKYICEHCGKGFPIYSELQGHQLAKHDIGPYFNCKHCSYKAPRQFLLREHERLHTGERPYTCDKCGLTFRRKAIWRKHMIYHTEKTVQCPQCPRKFFRLAEMQAHANSMHERKYMYLCHKCDTVYAKGTSVRRHLMEKHGIPREMQGKITRINKGRGIGLVRQ